MAQQRKVRQATNTPSIDESYIRNYTDERSFDKGRRYFNDGAVSDARKTGPTIKACCEGSQPYPYKVSATFGKNRIKGASCSCPVGSGGRCKHVVAMLLEWLNSPDEFRKSESMDASLAKRSKEELVALIKQMVASYPELESLAELPPSGMCEKRGYKAILDICGRQAADAFRHVREGWGAEARIAANLGVVLAGGESFIEKKDYSSAAAVFCSVAKAVLERYEMFRDEEGELIVVVADCADDLGKCLDGTNDAEVRKNILRALFDIYNFDTDFGGIGMSDDVPSIILKNATKNECKLVVDWIHATMPSEDKNELTDEWHRKEYEAFLRKLENNT